MGLDLIRGIVVNNEKQVRKKILTKLPKFRFYVVVSFFMALLIQLVSLIPPVLMKNIVDIYIPQKQLSKTLSFIVLFIFIPVFITAFSTLYNYILNIVGRKMGYILMQSGFEKLVYQKIPYYDNHNSAQTASYCKSEAVGYVVFWIFDIPQLAAGVLGGIVVFFLIAQINLYIALGLLLYIPFNIIPSKFFSKIIEKNVKKIVENNAETSQIINDTFRGIRFVKSMLLEKLRINELKRVNESTVKIWSKTSAVDNMNGIWANQFADTLFTGTVFSVSAVLIIKGRLSLGVLLLILNYMPKFFSAVKAISNTNLNFNKKLGEYDKFFSFLLLDDERTEDKGKLDFSFKNNIEFKNVCFSYTKERGNVLNGLTLSIPCNKWIGIIGSSGAGKTTVFDLLLKFYEGYTGEITVDGVSIDGISASDIRKNITKVSQDLFLFPGTVRDNLLMIKPSADDSQLYEIIDKVGLSDFVGRLPNGIDTDIGEDGIQISGGEKQRLCLAQGLLRNSKLLLLDEVTANVDTLSEQSIKETVFNLMKETDLTVVSVSHRLSFLDKTDNIFVMENGTVVDGGMYSDLMNNNKLFTTNTADKV